MRLERVSSSRTWIQSHATRPDPCACSSRWESRRYARKGWTQAKIDRAIASSRSSRAATPRNDLPGQFAAAIETLARQGACLTLLAHMFSGKFDEPFEIVGATQLPLENYMKAGHHFPEDTLVTLLA